MNFLAHLHLASLADSSLLGNLLADFVRGNPDGQYSPDIVSGIRMHRRVDVMTDSLPEVKIARSYFRDDFRRVSPITLDVVWDHFLSRHWNSLHPQQPLEDFIAACQQEIEPQLPGMPERFQNLNFYIWPQRWLERYAVLPFIGEVLQGMASRRPKLSALSGSFHDIELNYDALEQLFWQFYPVMMQQAKDREL
ncbi:acyl carrier protein phosphodiesterase [Rahnella selenatireducens]|uniref:acyl carrier protein phosphodiesterase n=1 Tax=Rahnella selenatireducens TaxID=3389797 RepID=UPI003968D660